MAHNLFFQSHVFIVRIKKMGIRKIKRLVKMGEIEISKVGLWSRIEKRGYEKFDWRKEKMGVDKYVNTKFKDICMNRWDMRINAK
jgi:hypothetical protein